jgi:hypothetical protein
MEATEMEFAQPERSRTPFVVALLALAAATFSYLGAFAIPQALIASQVIHPWPAGHDPRLRWIGISFAVLMMTFMVGSAVARILNSRELKNIDAMIDAEET